MDITQTKTLRFALGALGALALLVGVLGGKVLMSSEQGHAAALVSTFACSESSSATDATIAMEVGDLKRIFILIDSDTATTDAIDMELTYDPDEFAIVSSTGTDVTSVTTSGTFTDLGTYSLNSVTSGAGCNTGLDCIRLNWGASGSGYDTAAASDVYGSFYIEALQEVTDATISFDFDGANTGFTTDTDVIEEGTSEDTLSAVTDCTITVTEAAAGAGDLTVTKTSDDTVYEYDGDSALDIDYTIDIDNDGDEDSEINVTDDVVDAIEQAISEIADGDLDDVKESIEDTADVTGSSTTVVVDEAAEGDLDDGELNIEDITVDAADTVTVEYTVTIPEGLDEEDFGIDDDSFYAQDVDDGDVESDDNDFDDGDEATGEDDTVFVSLGDGGSICVAFDDSIVIVDGSGDDVFVFEDDDDDGDNDQDGEAYDVSFSEDTDCSSPEAADNEEEDDSAGFDLGDTSLDFARSILIEDSGDDHDADAPGADIDAVGIFNIGVLVENTFSVDGETTEDIAIAALDLSDLIDSPVDDSDAPTNLIDSCLTAAGLNPALPADRTGDKDGDGISNEKECDANFCKKTDPNDADTDNDGIPDGWECDNGLDATDPTDAPENPEGDGCTNLEEYLQSKKPFVVDCGLEPAPPPSPPTLPPTGSSALMLIGAALLVASAFWPRIAAEALRRR